MSLNINNYFETRRNQFHKQTITRIWRTNPFRSLVPMSPFPMEEGLTPTVVTYTGDLPTAYPTALTLIGVDPNTGGTSNYCAQTPTTINNGRIERTFQLSGTAFNSNIFCLSDLKRDWQAAEAVGAYEKILKQYMTTWWSDFYRVQNIAMADNKFCVNDPIIANYDIIPGTADFSTCTHIPSQQLGWAHLDQIYMDLVRRGVAEEYAVGVDSKGRPVIPIILGIGYIQKLFRDDGTGTVNTAYDAVKFYDPKSLLSLMGINESKHGWMPIADVYPIRFGNATPITTVAGLTFANAIYPTVNTGPTSYGSRAIPNPLWLNAARGGIAQWEVATILPANIYETHYEPIDPTAFSNMQFDPIEYVGEFKWVNNKTFNGVNDLGNLGYYRADVRVAAKPLNPDLAMSILTTALNV